MLAIFDHAWREVGDDTWQRILADDSQAMTGLPVAVVSPVLLPENQTRQALDLAERMKLTLVVFEQKDVARIRLAEQLKRAAA